MAFKDKSPTLYGRHRKPDALLQPDTPRIPKISHPLPTSPNDDVTVLKSIPPTQPNNSQKISSFVDSVSNAHHHKIRPVSYDSSLPSSTNASGSGQRRGGRGGRGRKKPVVTTRMGGKEGQQWRGHQRKKEAGTAFDELLLSNQTKTRATRSVLRSSDVVPSQQHIVVCDSPPSSPSFPSFPTRQSRASSSSDDDRNPVEKTASKWEETKGLDKPHPPSPGVRPAGGSDGGLKQILSHNQNRDRVEGVCPGQKGGVVTECIELDEEDECEITATTSRYFPAAAQLTVEKRGRRTKLSRERRDSNHQDKGVEEEEALSTHPSPLHTPVKKGGRQEQQTSPSATVSSPHHSSLIPRQDTEVLTSFRRTAATFNNSIRPINFKQPSQDFIDVIDTGDSGATPTRGSSLQTPPVAPRHMTPLLKAVHESGVAEGTQSTITTITTPSPPHHHTITAHQPPSPPHHHTITTHQPPSPPHRHTVPTHQPPRHEVEFTFTTHLSSSSSAQDQRDSDGEFESSPHKFRPPLIDSRKWRGRAGREVSGAGGEGEGGGGGRRGLRGRGRGGARGREEGTRGRSVFDHLEPGSSNSSSFYESMSRGHQMVSAAVFRGRGKQSAVHVNTQGLKPPALKKTHLSPTEIESDDELNFATKSGVRFPQQKTLLSQGSFHRPLASLEHRGKQHAKQSSNRLPHLTKKEFSLRSGGHKLTLDITSAHFGLLETVNVSDCKLTTAELSMTVVHEDKSVPMTFPLTGISEWKMNLTDPPRCIIIRLFPGEAKRQVNRLSCQFAIDSTSFLNAESKNRCEQYLILHMDSAPSPQTVGHIHDCLEQRKNSSSLHFHTETDMNVTEVNALLSSRRDCPTHPLNSKSSHITELLSASHTEPEPHPPQMRVRRSTRLRTRQEEKRMRWNVEEEEEGEEGEWGEIVQKPSGDPKKILLTYKPEGTRVNIEITEMDLDCLAPGEQLNDKIIDFYLMYLWYDLLRKECSKSVHIFSSFFHSRLMNSSQDNNRSLSTPEKLHDRVKSWTRHVDLFSKDYIVLPVCTRAHWFVAFICYPGLYKPSPAPPSKPRLLRSSKKPCRRSRAKPTATPRKRKVSTIDLISPGSGQEDWEEGGGEGGGGGEGEGREGTKGKGGKADAGECEDPLVDLSESEAMDTGSAREDTTTDMDTRDEADTGDGGGSRSEDEVLRPKAEGAGQEDHTLVLHYSSDEEDVLLGEKAMDTGCTSDRQTVNEGAKEEKEKEEEEEEDQEEGREREMVGDSETEAEERLESEDTQTDMELGKSEGGREGSGEEEGEGAEETERGVSGREEVMGEDGKLSEKRLTTEELEKRPCVMVLDPLGIQRKAIAKRINDYLTMEWQAKMHHMPQRNFQLKIVYPKLILQDNSSDCGVFVLQYVESLFNHINQGLPPPSCPSEWGSYNTLKQKRRDLEQLIRSLGEKQRQTLPPSDPTDQNPPPSHHSNQRPPPSDPTDPSPPSPPPSPPSPPSSPKAPS